MRFRLSRRFAPGWWGGVSFGGGGGGRRQSGAPKAQKPAMGDSLYAMMYWGFIILFVLAFIAVYWLPIMIGLSFLTVLICIFARVEHKSAPVVTKTSPQDPSVRR